MTLTTGQCQSESSVYLPGCQVTGKDAYPLPRIDGTLQSLGRAQWFSTLDLATRFSQVTVQTEDHAKTVFHTPTGLYQFNVMPFGLCNAPSTSQRLVEVLLRASIE
ncbi:hypothetical protein M514_10875 [Trichuris suis]|uniref:Reverse transcriptase domain-containing protein n=1 Tax=Trichuris suis TaxID=68888 RepID=A0A085NK06_9BILA|nr:hypothetical protein M513_10875 [Trichuris suis]KFD69802.1 hypothetical protein M514_10875 [Trichuris suis]